MTRTDCIKRYLDWMYNLVSDERYTEGRSYEKLLSRLYHTDFTYTIDLDGNRAEDGVCLRYHFAYDCGYDDAMIASYLDTRDSSILEMMVALSNRCENIMDNPDLGNRTGQWFWTMIFNLGLEDMDDENYDDEYVTAVIERLLNREYEPDGEGGLFTVPDCRDDLRTVEIWTQLCWYLDTIL